MAYRQNQRQNYCNCPDDWDFNDYCDCDYENNYNGNQTNQQNCYYNDNDYNYNQNNSKCNHYNNNNKKCHHREQRQSNNRCCLCNILRCFRCW